MEAKKRTYQVVDLTPSRRAFLNMLDLPVPEHRMLGLLEVDVTRPRQFIEDYKARSGETLSFTGFLTYCLARAVDADRSVQAYLRRRRQMIICDDVDVQLMVEKKEGEKRSLMGCVVQKANHKTFLEIHQEIRAVQAAPTPANRGMPGWFRSLMLLPWPLSRLVRSIIAGSFHRDPLSFLEMGGTVAITSVGMFGEGHSGWGIFPLTQVLGLVVGSIAWKPAVVEGRIEPREILHVTVLFDHDVIDGAPAARFTRRLIELIESGAGLYEMERV